MSINEITQCKLTISLGDMKLEDSFQIFVPLELSNYTLHTFLSRLFEEGLVCNTPVSLLMDLDENPDLSDMFGELLLIYNQWRLNKCSMKFLNKNGNAINLTDLLSNHIQFQELNMILEQRYEIFHSDTITDDHQIALLKWMKEITTLYLIDSRVNGIHSDDDLLLRDHVDHLISRQLIILDNVSKKYEVTTKGRNYITDLMSETERYIDQYDIFHDVKFDYDAYVIEFGSGKGVDLRVPVFENEGLDPIRTVFLLRIYDGTLSGYLDRQPNMTYSTSFYNEILQPVLDHLIIPEATLDWIIENGLDDLDEYNENRRLLNIRG